jgi:hypothetical protein
LLAFATLVPAIVTSQLAPEDPKPEKLELLSATEADQSAPVPAAFPSTLMVNLARCSESLVALERVGT